MTRKVRDRFEREPGPVRQPCPNRLAFVSAYAAVRHRLRNVTAYRCSRCSFFHLGQPPANDHGLFKSDDAA